MDKNTQEVVECSPEKQTFWYIQDLVKGKLRVVKTKTPGKVKYKVIREGN